MGKRNSEKCENCGVKEDAEHIILYSRLNEVERRVFKDNVQQTGREWNLLGILGSEGEGEDIRITRKTLFKFLKDTTQIAN